MERDADVVVVGAGIVGCATAYFLARRGARVVVVERGSVPGEQSRTRLLRARDLEAVVPGLAGDWVGGMHTPGDGHADPEKTTDAFARAAVSHGASLHLGCAVQDITTRAGAVGAVVTEHGEIRTPTVVCAAGAWSARLARRLGLDLPQRWVGGTVARTTRFFLPNY